MKHLAALFLALSFQAHAGLCDQDAKKFCSGVDGGMAPLMKCLDGYAGQISATCAKEIKDFKAQALQKNPCFTEVGDFCSDVPVEGRSIDLCLLKHENRLGAKCAADFKTKKPVILSKEVCANDIVASCYNTISEPEAATTRCLIKNQPKLAAICKKHVDMRITELKLKNPCFTDIEKNCPTQITFSDIQNCLEKKLTTLAPLCKAEVQNEINKEKSNPCYADLRKHCKPGLTPSEQHNCLNVNEKELTRTCRDFRETQSGKLKKMVQVCEADRKKLCGTAPFQNGMVLKCLKTNAAQVSPACKALL